MEAADDGDGNELCWARDRGIDVTPRDVCGIERGSFFPENNKSLPISLKHFLHLLSRHTWNPCGHFGEHAVVLVAVLAAFVGQVVAVTAAVMLTPGWKKKL
jgi:hypothetical protein